MTIGREGDGPEAIAAVAANSIDRRAMLALIAAKARLRKRLIIDSVFADAADLAPMSPFDQAPACHTGELPARLRPRPISPRRLRDE